MNTTGIDNNEYTQPAAERLWQMLKDRQVKDMFFFHHCHVGMYTLEFYCPAVYLAVELYNEDDSSDIPDAEREEYLEDCYGIRIIRFDRQEVLDNPSRVLNEIVRQIEGRMFREEEPKPHS